MAHLWHAGVLSQSSWHGLESVESLPDAATLIKRGEETGAWPVAVALEKMTSTSGLTVPGSAVVADYRDGQRRAIAAVGRKYRPLDTAEWRATVEAAVAAGATPAGAFALNGGARILATFEIAGGNDGTGLRNFMHIADSLDGSLVHLAGGSTIRVVCANTLSAAMREGGFGAVKHTASINDRAATLRGAIEAHVKSGEAIRDLYKRAKETRVGRADAEAIFSTLFPASTDQLRKLAPAKATRLDNVRTEAIRAMARPENNEGKGSLATLWNGATWMVDRDADGNARPARGGADALDSLLFGSRGKRVEEIRNVIEVVLRDGTTQLMSAQEATSHGIDPTQIGRALMNDMLS